MLFCAIHQYAWINVCPGCVLDQRKRDAVLARAKLRGQQFEDDTDPRLECERYRDDTPTLDNCDDWGTDKGQFHGRF